jgi:hypothetical protein
MFTTTMPRHFSVVLGIYGRRRRGYLPEALQAEGRRVLQRSQTHGPVLQNQLHGRYREREVISIAGH